MSKARNRHTNNTVIGAGECFIGILGAGGVKRGRALSGGHPQRRVAD